MTLTWEQARCAAHAAGAPLEGEQVALGVAAGRVLAEPVVALVDLPGVDTVAMDGWAVNGAGPWTVVGTSPAGAPPLTLSAGEAAEVATGSQRPAGATAVLRLEHGRLVGALVSGPARAADIRRRGEQCRRGQQVLAAGARLYPPALGLAAAVGVDTVLVRRRPRVAGVVLGDEVLTGGLPAAGQVRDALGPQLPGWIASFGADLTGLCQVGDDLAATVAALSRPADVLVVTGGTSAGRGDHLRAALGRLAAQPLVPAVAVRPGHPMLLHRLPSGTLVVGLPGNPLAAVVALVTLLWPLLDGALGRPLPVLPVLPASAGLGLVAPADGVSVVPCRWVAGALVAAQHAGPAMLRGVAGAAGLAVLRADGPALWLAFPWTG